MDCSGRVYGTMRDFFGFGSCVSEERGRLGGCEDIGSKD